MAELPRQVHDQVEVLRDELDELVRSSAWSRRDNIEGSRALRSVSNRIVLSAKRLEAFVKESTFSR